jgi:hypothetical protein
MWLPENRDAQAAGAEGTQYPWRFDEQAGLLAFMLASSQH